MIPDKDQRFVDWLLDRWKMQFVCIKYVALRYWPMTIAGVAAFVWTYHAPNDVSIAFSYGFAIAWSFTMLFVAMDLSHGGEIDVE